MYVIFSLVVLAAVFLVYLIAVGAAALLKDNIIGAWTAAILVAALTPGLVALLYIFGKVFLSWAEIL